MRQSLPVRPPTRAISDCRMSALRDQGSSQARQVGNVSEATLRFGAERPFPSSADGQQSPESSFKSKPSSCFCNRRFRIIRVHVRSAAAAAASTSSATAQQGRKTDSFCIVDCRACLVGRLCVEGTSAKKRFVKCRKVPSPWRGPEISRAWFVFDARPTPTTKNTGWGSSSARGSNHQI